MTHSLFTPAQLREPLYPCDILTVAGTGWISRRIMRRTREKGEEPSAISHVGMVTTAGTIRDAVVTEAAGGRVRSVRIDSVYGEGQGLAILRPRNIPGIDLDAIRGAMIRQVGQRYGYEDIVAHWLASVTGWAWLRRLVGDRTPICSQAIDAAMRPSGYGFGVVSPTPDDIWDFALEHPGRYSWPFGGGELRAL